MLNTGTLEPTGEGYAAKIADRARRIVATVRGDPPNGYAKVALGVASMFFTIIVAMLGFGTLRTVEKMHGRAK